MQTLLLLRKVRLLTSWRVNRVFRIDGNVVWTTPYLSSVNEAETRWDRPRKTKKNKYRQTLSWNLQKYVFWQSLNWLPSNTKMNSVSCPNHLEISFCWPQLEQTNVSKEKEMGKTTAPMVLRIRTSLNISQWHRTKITRTHSLNPATETREYSNPRTSYPQMNLISKAS